MTHTIEYTCPTHGTIRETVTEGCRNTAIRYGYDCLHCGVVCTAAEVEPAAATAST